MGLATMVNLEQINPRMLPWARETAGFSVPKAAEKLGLKDTAKPTATKKLQALESGDGTDNSWDVLSSGARGRRCNRLRAARRKPCRSSVPCL